MMYKKIISLNENIVNTDVEGTGSDLLVKNKDDDHGILSNPELAYMTALSKMPLTSLEEIESWKAERDKVQQYFAQEVQKLEGTEGKNKQEKIEQIKKLAAKKDEIISLIIDQLRKLYGRDSGLITRAEEEIWGEILLETGKKHGKTIERGARRHWEKEFNLAVNILMRANLRLVVSTAKKYRRENRSFLELIQIGNNGLQRGIVRFDYRKGFKVSTYCTRWIRQAIEREIRDNGKVIEISYELKSINEFARRVARSASKGERVDWKNMDYERLTEKILEKTENKAWQENLTPEKVQRAVEALNWSFLAEAENEEGETFALFDLLIIDKNSSEEVNSLASFDPATDSVARSVDEKQVKQRLQEVLAELTPREQKIIKLHFGIDEDYEYTLEEIKDHFGVTRERIRQIEKKALNKLRHPSRREKLLEAADFYDLI